MSLFDDTDGANGSGGALPYDSISLFVTAPDDMSALADYDDWLYTLVTHEDTHVLHTDNVTGFPALVNAILGKTYAPNQTQPHWILEGLAVAMESDHTSGGRLRSTQFDMFMRADVLEGYFARLDQISHFPLRWPGGNLWYLYGAEFVQWISDVYGPDTFAAVAHDYGQDIIPWGINRSIRRVTGRTYPELYAGFYQHLLERYRAQADAVRQRGLRVGSRLTYTGWNASYPRFLPACARSGREREIEFWRSDKDSRAALYRLRLGDRGAALSEPAAWIRGYGQTASFEPDCGVFFDAVVPNRWGDALGDLYWMPPGAESPTGFERNRVRLTEGRRARDPDLSPDGRRLVYVTNSRGTSTLRIADVTPEHRLAHERTLVPSARFEQAFTPRFSPDGSRVAYSAWTTGGYRDLRIVDVDTGRFRELMHDRAIDQQPVWSPDGAWLYFTSDRTGIANVYACEVATGALRQVTNVINGAYMPAVSDDGKLLVYVGYTKDGWDLYSLPLDRSQWLAALPAVDRRPVDSGVADTRWPVKPYNPLPSLRPRSYTVDYATGSYGGEALTLATSGTDAVGMHAFSLALTVESEHPELQGSFDYSYHRLPYAFRASVFRSVAPRKTYTFSDTTPTIDETLDGVTTGLDYPIAGEFDAQRVTLSYTVANYAQKLPIGPNIDPYASVTREPSRGYLGLVRFSYGYSNAESTPYSVSLERGITLSASIDYAGPAVASESTLTALNARATGYVLMPWARHHVLAVAASGGVAMGTYPRRGFYYTGGYENLPLLDAFTSGIRQGAFVLRGYAPTQFVGTAFNLYNAEYRFPIAVVDRGVSTLPVFLRQISGAAFADFGGAFNQLNPDDPFGSYHLGLGAELWFDVVLGYFVGGNVRLGIARGTDSDAPGTDFYAAVSSPF